MSAKEFCGRRRRWWFVVAIFVAAALALWWAWDAPSEEDSSSRDDAPDVHVDPLRLAQLEDEGARMPHGFSAVSGVVVVAGTNTGVEGARLLLTPSFETRERSAGGDSWSGLGE